MTWRAEILALTTQSIDLCLPESKLCFCAAQPQEKEINAGTQADAKEMNRIIPARILADYSHGAAAMWLPEHAGGCSQELLAWHQNPFLKSRLPW